MMVFEGEAFGRRFGQEGGALTGGISVLFIKDAAEGSLAPSTV